MKYHLTTRSAKTESAFSAAFWCLPWRRGPLWICHTKCPRSSGGYLAALLHRGAASWLRPLILNFQPPLERGVGYWLGRVSRSLPSARASRRRGWGWAQSEVWGTLLVDLATQPVVPWAVLACNVCTCLAIREVVIGQQVWKDMCGRYVASSRRGVCSRNTSTSRSSQLV